MRHLTQVRLRQMLRYNKYTGIFTWKETRGGRRMNTIAGSIKNGRSKKEAYVMIQIDGVIYGAHRLAFLYVTGQWPTRLDHRDCNGVNNQWNNLRVATSSQNAANCSRKNKTGFKCVYYSKRKKKWRARINPNGKRILLGWFVTPEQAEAAYAKAAKQYYGQYARLK